MCSRVLAQRGVRDLPPPSLAAVFSRGSPMSAVSNQQAGEPPLRCSGVQVFPTDGCASSPPPPTSKQVSRRSGVQVFATDGCASSPPVRRLRASASAFASAASARRPSRHMLVKMDPHIPVSRVLPISALDNGAWVAGVAVARVLCLSCPFGNVWCGWRTADGRRATGDGRRAPDSGADAARPTDHAERPSAERRLATPTPAPQGRSGTKRDERPRRAPQRRSRCSRSAARRTPPDDGVDRSGCSGGQRDIEAGTIERGTPALLRACSAPYVVDADAEPMRVLAPARARSVGVVKARADAADLPATRATWTGASSESDAGQRDGRSGKGISQPRRPRARITARPLQPASRVRGIRQLQRSITPGRGGRAPHSR